MSVESSKIRKLTINLGYVLVVVLSILNFGKLPNTPLTILLEVIGITLFIVSIFVATYIHSSYPKQHDKPSDFSELIKSGPYSVVRHPFYLSLIVNQISVPAILASWLGFLAFLVVLPFWIYLIKVEERELIEYWGEEYLKYMKEVPALIPKLKLKF